MIMKRIKSAELFIFMHRWGQHRNRHVPHAQGWATRVHTHASHSEVRSHASGACASTEPGIYGTETPVHRQVSKPAAGKLWAPIRHVWTGGGTNASLRCSFSIVGLLVWLVRLCLGAGCAVGGWGVRFL